MAKVRMAVGTALAVGGVLGVSASPATAAPTNIYMHGTAKMASFTSWSTCQKYAAGTLKNITQHHGSVLPGRDYGGARTKCFPVANGRWSYLIAYTATSPVSAGDYTYKQSSSTFGDTFWAFNHTESGPSRTFTQPKCEAASNAFNQRVIDGLRVRLLTPGVCVLDPNSGERTFSTAYLGLSKGSGLLGDVGTSYSTSILAESNMLGYNAVGS